ncbi:MAG TPA: hypothetical protein V6C82_00905 [Chroococcales cyanobacterium]|jgi:DNA-binding beta-propeller fold protein YncE
MKKFILFLSLSLLAGCTPPTKATVTGNAAFSGKVLGPSRIVSSTKYKAEIPLANSLVYLANLQGEFLVDEHNKNLVCPTNQYGQYRFEKAPSGMSVMVHAILSKNERLSGYAYTQESNTIDLNIASTYCAEFFRCMMKDKDVSLVKADSLKEIQAATQELLSTDKLGVPDLTIGGGADMCNAYVTAFDRRLSDMWTGITGKRPLAMTCFAGNYRDAKFETGKMARETSISTPYGIAADGEGNIFLAAEELRLILVIKPDGRIERFAGNGGKIVQSAFVQGSERESTSIADPLDLGIDKEGNLYWTTYNNADNLYGNAVFMLCRRTGKNYGLAMQADRIYRLGGGTDGSSGYADGPLAQAKFNDPTGICLDDVGNLYVADRQNDSIRLIERAGGAVSTLCGTKQENWPVPTKFLNDGPLESACFAAPQDLVWRRKGGQEELYLIDSFDNRIRLISSGDGFKSGHVSTLVGSLESWGFRDGPLSSAKVALVVGDGIPVNLQVTNTGLALDGDRLYLSDFSNGRIRMIDLAANTIETVAGGGKNDKDGLALEKKIRDPGYLCVVPSGANKGCLLVTDPISCAAFRINTDWGL